MHRNLLESGLADRIEDCVKPAAYATVSTSTIRLFLHHLPLSLLFTHILQSLFLLLLNPLRADFLHALSLPCVAICRYRRVYSLDVKRSIMDEWSSARMLLCGLGRLVGFLPFLFIRGRGLRVQGGVLRYIVDCQSGSRQREGQRESWRMKYRFRQKFMQDGQLGVAGLIRQSTLSDIIAVLYCS